MRNLFALIGLVTVAMKGYEWYTDYDNLKKERDAREAEPKPDKGAK